MATVVATNGPRLSLVETIVAVDQTGNASAPSNMKRFTALWGVSYCPDRPRHGGRLERVVRVEEATWILDQATVNSVDHVALGVTRFGHLGGP